jgi:hypothetical protein
MGVAKNIIDASKATYSSIENRLSGIFKTIPPRREFVRGLGRQIQIHPPAISYRLTDLHFLLIMIASMFSLVALIFVGIRAVINFFSGRRRTPRQA